MNPRDEVKNFFYNRFQKRRDKDRDSEVLLFLYGFDSVVKPTYQQVADHFGFAKQNVEYILADIARYPLGEHELSSVSTALQSVLPQLPCSLEKYLSLLEENGLRLGLPSLVGILEIFSLFDSSFDLVLIDNDIKKLSRNYNRSGSVFFLVSDAELMPIEAEWALITKAPGKCGIANLHRQSTGNLHSFFSEVLRSRDDVWCYEEDNSFWYIFEKRDNRIINYSKKVFSVFEDCEASRLAQAFFNAFGSRSLKKAVYPPLRIVDKYIRESHVLAYKHGMISYNGEKRTISSNEKLTVEYLINNGPVSRAEVSEYLEKNGVSASAAGKLINQSPLVYVDKSHGRGSYIYEAVGSRWNQNSRIMRYKLKLEKLTEFGTDFESVAFNRREQSVLREWLFEGLHVEACAICGNTFNVKSLVAAHKKFRRTCSEEERVDPNIVMPLCLFGCDYLYEMRYVRVENGCVVEGDLPNDVIFEEVAVSKVVGRKIPEKWTNGCDRYFQYSPPRP